MFTFISMLNIFISLTLFVQVVVALLLILVVLMQRPKQEGLGAAFGAGMTDQMFGAQTTNVLQKATVWFGIIFFSSTLILAILTNKKNTAAAIQSQAPAAVENAGNQADSPSLAEQLTQAEEAAPPSEDAQAKEPAPVTPNNAEKAQPAPQKTNPAKPDQPVKPQEKNDAVKETQEVKE